MLMARMVATVKQVSPPDPAGKRKRLHSTLGLSLLLGCRVPRGLSKGQLLPTETLGVDNHKSGRGWALILPIGFDL